MDIATLLESHRAHLLEVAADYVSEGDLAKTKFAMEVAHDRATTKVLLDYVRGNQAANGEVKPPGQAALTTPSPKKSNRLRAGSKAAKDRAIKAGETRRKNLAARQREEIEKDSGAGDSPAALGGAA